MSAAKASVTPRGIMTKITSEEMAADILNPFKDVLLKGGIDDKFLIKQLKSEFRSKEPKIIKIKGAVNPESLPRGYKIVGQSGEVIHCADGGQDYSDGETIIEYQVKNIGVSQRARMDVHKLRGDYPAVKQSIEFPDENGKPQDVNGLEIATRLAYLLNEANRRKNESNGSNTDSESDN